MKVLFCGDIVGRSGRQALNDHLPDLIKEHSIDFVIANGENSAGGFGITGKIANDLFDLGVDVVTSGNHMWDKRDIMLLMDQEKRLLRPLNFPKNNPGRGFGTYKTKKKETVLVVNLMAQIFMPSCNDPFEAIEDLLQYQQLKKTADFIFVDFHGQAESEKQAMGLFCDGRVSAVVGTHTHVPTADHRILPQGTAYQTDAGMCGDYLSVIGMEAEEPVRRFVQKIRYGAFKPAKEEGTIRGVLVESDDKTGLAVKMTPIEKGRAIYNERNPK